jgi:hemerythrin
MSGVDAMAWTDSWLLGYAPMDATHREFVVIVNALLTCPDGELAANLEHFARHAEQHFADENRWMETTDFPPRHCHVDEHNAVLSSVYAVLELVRSGDVVEGRRLARALADWFPGHAIHLDSALLHWMVKRTHGGKPLVFRRHPVQRGKS